MTRSSFRGAELSNGIWILYKEGEGFGNNGQSELTPLQRMFIQVMKEQEQKEKQKQAQSSSGPSPASGSGPAPNPNYEPGGGGKGLDETTIYHNTGYEDGTNPNEGIEQEIREKFQE